MSHHFRLSLNMCLSRATLPLSLQTHKSKKRLRRNARRTASAGTSLSNQLFLLDWLDAREVRTR